VFSHSWSRKARLDWTIVATISFCSNILWRTNLNRVATPALPCHAFMSYYPTATVPAPTDAHRHTDAVPRIDDGQMPAAAGGTFYPELGFAVAVVGHGRLRFCSSAKLIRSGFLAGWASVPSSIAPCIDAATAVPTTQSNQWLSPRSGRIFHSSTVRPRPSVFYAVFGGEMFGEKPVLFGAVAVQGEATAVAQGDDEASLDEGLPVVGVVHDVADGPLAMDVWHSPVVSNAVARLSTVFRKRLARGANESAVAGHDDARVCRLPTELVNDVG